MGTTQIILIVLVLVLVIVYPILVSARNKKESQKLNDQANSLKKGDKVLTTSGVYGTIVDMQLEGEKKIVTIETGTDKKKGYISVDAFAIYNVFKEEDKTAAVEAKVEGKKETKAEPKKEEIEAKEEIKTDELISSDSNTAADIEAQVSGKKPKSKKKWLSSHFFLFNK